MATVRLFPARSRASPYRGSTPWVLPVNAGQDDSVGATANTSTQQSSISFVGSAQSRPADTGNVNLIISVAGAVDGDVMYTTLSDGGTATPGMATEANGWTLLATSIHSVASPGVSQQIWTYRRIADSEPASYFWGLAFATIARGLCTTLRGVDNVNPEDALTTTTNTATSNVQTPPITTVTDGAFVLSFVDSDSPAPPVAPSNMTLIDAFGASGTVEMGVARTQVSPLGTFTPNAWTSAGAVGAGHTIAVRPARPGGTSSIWRSYDGSVIPDGATITAVAIAWKAKVTAGNGTVFTLSGRGYRGVQLPLGQGDTHIDNAVVADGTFKTGSMDITSWRSWTTGDFLASAGLEIEMAASSNDSVGSAAWTLDYVALDVTYTDPAAQTWGPLTDINATEDVGTFVGSTEKVWT